MKINKNKNYFFEVIFIILFSLLALYTGVYRDGNYLYDYLFLLYAFYAFLRSITITYSRKEIIILISVTILFVLNSFFSKGNSWLSILIILLGSRKIAIDRIIDSLLICKIISFIGVLTFVNLHILENKQVLTYRYGEVVARHAYGFNHPNTLHAFFFIIIMLFIYRFFTKLKYLHLVIILIINQYIYSISVARTGYFLVIFAVVFYIILRNNFLIQQVTFKIAPYVQFIAMFSLLLFSLFFFNTPIVSKLDNLLSGRIYYAKLILTDSLNLFGNEINYFIDRYILFFHDNSYSSTLALSGIIITFGYMYLYFKTSRKLVQDHNIAALYLFVSNSLLFYSEDYIREPFLNITLFFIGKYIFNELGEINE
ncbi:TPA: hypothetical protein ACGL3H_000157 [Streptococcus agalactiae]|uniref:hypothetical protein n=1 Tax=Streptococcus agalactiae TaxID=1311 RepID=UPI0005DC3A3C|nr:hypothetical protein [Streptococcus agalactiae]HEO2249003.1 hypothetical protein [Streptococcus agalactiae 515]KLJ86447.1 hypothetical protein WB01_03530 [Streptococcus agalactiae]CNH10878.1 polysaccharide biosynthesis protein cpsH(V) [Streptococcus agalactiae]HEO2753240.1 hypothetical protein [Streptococcus agalactiae]HEO2865446.1 hypothetical protein [Streptococcus agalactiae]